LASRNVRVGEEISVEKFHHALIRQETTESKEPRNQVKSVQNQKGAAHKKAFPRLEPSIINSIKGNASIVWDTRGCQVRDGLLPREQIQEMLQMPPPTGIAVLLARDTRNHKEKKRHHNLDLSATMCRPNKRIYTSLMASIC
jgi:hypothetical protein